MQTTQHPATDRRFVALSTPNTLLLIAAAGPVLLASAYVLTAHLPATPWWNATTRVMPAGLMLLAIHPILPHGSWWHRSLILGTLNFAGFFAVQAFCLHRIPGGVAATIAAMHTVLVPLGATAFLGARLRLIQVAAALTGVAGTGLLVLRSTTRLDIAGVAAATVLALCTASGMLLIRRWDTPAGVHHFTVTAWQMLTGGLLLLPCAMLIEGRPPTMTLAGWAMTAWLTLGATATAFALIFGAMHHGLPPTSMSQLMLLCPLVATAGGWVLHHQTLTPSQLLGTGLILASVAAICQPPNTTPDK